MALLPRRLLNIGRILSQQNVNCRLCSSSSSDGGDKKEDKLLGLLSSFKDQKMHQKTVELKAKPTKRNVNPKAKSETSSSSSSSSSSDEELDQEAVQAVQNVAKAKSKRMKGNDDEKFEAKVTIESALLGRLKKINAETKTARQESEVSDVEQKDIASLFKNLKVVKEEKEPQMIKRPPMTKDVEAFLAKRREMRREARNKEIRKEYVPTNLFGEEKPLGIFSSDAKQVVTLKTWQAIEERELRILKTQPPRNLIEDLVSMTDDGQLWHFPINNEQGIEENEVIISKVTI